MLVQLNKCVVVSGSVLLRGHSNDGCLASSILFVCSELGQGTTSCSEEYCFGVMHCGMVFVTLCYQLLRYVLTMLV